MPSSALPGSASRGRPGLEDFDGFIRHVLFGRQAARLQGSAGLGPKVFDVDRMPGACGQPFEGLLFGRRAPA